MTNRLKKITLFLILLNLLSINCYHIFFDMDGVLIKTSIFKAFTQLGLQVARCPDLKNRYFEFLNHIDDNDSNDNETKYGTKKMPSYMCDWLKGKMNSQELVNHVLKEADNNEEFFKNNTEKNVIRKSVTYMLPKNNAKVATPIKQMVKTLKDIKNKKDKSGYAINTVYLATNCHIETFDSLKIKFPKIFDNFEKKNVIISSEISFIKPKIDFYQYILNKYKLSPKDCIFIDDQKENIDAAKKIGMHGILHKNSVCTRQELRRLGAL